MLSNGFRNKVVEIFVEKWGMAPGLLAEGGKLVVLARALVVKYFKFI
jgi:hypothetical protein